MCKKIRPAVMNFAEKMEYVLRENDHKSGWENEEINWLLERLFDEFLELDAVASGYDRTFSALEALNIAKEATDVANYAMMIADNASRRVNILRHGEKNA